MRHSSCVNLQGHVTAGYEAVRDAFLENFSRRHELGGACCVYRHGEKVVDIWGGVRNNATGEPWRRHRLRVRHESDGSDAHRRPARGGAGAGTAERHPRLLGRLAGCGLTIGHAAHAAPGFK